MIARQLVAQLKGGGGGGGGAAATGNTVQSLAPSMLAAAQSLPQNKGQLCPLVPAGESLPPSVVSDRDVRTADRKVCAADRKV